MIITPLSRKDAFAKLRKSTAKRGLSTGFIDVDEIVRLAKSYLMIITGYPGSGKSEWLDAVLLNTVLMHEWKITYYSPENHPTEEHMRKLAEKYLNKPITDFTIDEIDSSLAFLEKNFRWLYPENPELNTLLEQAKITQEENGLDCLVIDPWNAVTHKKQGNMIHEYLAEALTKVIRFGRDNNVLMAVVAHPTKPQKDKDGNYAPLNLYDISDGAMWRNKADIGILVNRPDMSKNEIEITTGKLKQKWMGKLATVRLDYDFRTGRFKGKHDVEYSLPHEIESPF